MPPARSTPCSVSLGELYSKCVQMVNENKVSMKNAFDLHLIDHMDDIVDSFMGGRKRATPGASGSGGGGDGRSFGGSRGKTSLSAVEEEAEHRFHEASCTIEASAKIYACRVDCVHTDTYRVLGGLSSADMADDEEGREGEKGDAKKRRRICGVNTLEKNEASLVQQHIEADEQSDPMFRRMAAAFDAGGAKGLLLAHIPIAEDISLVFNGDVPLNRAGLVARPMFQEQVQVPSNQLGLGEPGEACARIANARLCPEVDKFRRQLLGNVNMNICLPQELEELLGPAGPLGSATNALAIAASQALVPVAPAPAEKGSVAHAPAVPMSEIEDVCSVIDDVPGCDDGVVAFHPPAPGSIDLQPIADPVPIQDVPPLPLADAEALQPVPEPANGSENVIAFDELFEKFCGGGGPHQFAYFDECWSKLPPEKDGKASAVAIVDGQVDGTDGVLAAVPHAQEVREKPSKRPLFDLAGLDKPAKPIETEPVHKHQLSERAAHWQLHRDVPPYMIDRITMPSWPTWSKCDFACLGLRPHLMLKLVRKPQPEGDGPHCFSDLFSTVVVENPDAFPWLIGEARGNGRREDDQNDTRDGEVDFGDDIGEEDFDGNGLPAHLDVDPQDLFLRPDDKVVPGCDQEDLIEDNADDTSFMPGVDFDLVDQPATVGNTDIGYSRNSKFVDVKLVKKHLWDCISEDIAAAKTMSQPKAASSFQNLVDRTVKRLPRSETENLSVAVCFICALHLCNEKDLELASDLSKPLGDFDVVGPAV